MSGTGEVRSVGFFGRIGNWFRMQGIQFNLQRGFAQQARGAQGYLQHHDRAMRDIDAMGLSAYDKAMAQFSFRSRESERIRTDEAQNSPEVRSINIAADGQQNVARLTSDGEYLADMMQRTGQRAENTFQADIGMDCRGKGIGAFLGRLFTGRLRQETRVSGRDAYARFNNDTLMDGKNVDQVCKLSMCREAIESGAVTVDDILSGRHKVPGFGELGGGEKTEMCNAAIAEYEARLAAGAIHGYAPEAGSTDMSAVAEEPDVDNSMTQVDDEATIDFIGDIAAGAAAVAGAAAGAVAGAAVGAAQGAVQGTAAGAGLDTGEQESVDMQAYAGEQDPNIISTVDGSDILGQLNAETAGGAAAGAVAGAAVGAAQGAAGEQESIDMQAYAGEQDPNIINTVDGSDILRQLNAETAGGSAAQGAEISVDELGRADAAAPSEAQPEGREAVAGEAHPGVDVSAELTAEKVPQTASPEPSAEPAAPEKSAPQMGAM